MKMNFKNVGLLAVASVFMLSMTACGSEEVEDENTTDGDVVETDSVDTDVIDEPVDTFQVEEDSLAIDEIVEEVIEEVTE
jgi:hypothetical protein